MRIGYVLKYFPKLSETFVLHEMVALEAAGADVEVFALEASGGAPLAPALGRLAAPVHYLGQMSDGALLSGLRARPDEVRRAVGLHLPRLLAELEGDKTGLTRLRQVVELALHVRMRGIEHLHAHFAGPAADLARLVARLTGVPYSFTCHAKDIYHESVTPAFFRALCAEAKAVVTVCEANRLHIQHHLVPDLNGKLHVLYNGVDLDVFHPRDQKAEGAVPLIVGVGRLVAKKGFAYLVDAVARLERSGRSVECVIAGEGRERADLEQRIAALGVRGIRLIGAARHDEVRALLGRATAVALPCVVDDDGNRDALPTVLLEAMAAGVPVVSTPVTGVAEIIDDGVTGLLVPERDAPALAEALGRLLDDPQWAERLGRAGRARAEERFDLHKNAETLLDLLQADSLQEAVA
ncbi:MAG: glycosyltransferase family 4 protein [Gemmatimonadota bacterium]